VLLNAIPVAADEKVPEETATPNASKNAEGQDASLQPVQAILRSGYVDANRDGMNDLFQDANGDGINDVNQQAYDHHFYFVDANGDGINDLFVDRDGDGVNDLNGHFMDVDGDGICDNVIDHDGDGINDITGIEYHHRSLEGFRFGRMDEERGAEHQMFIDEDGDGMNDLQMPDMQAIHAVNGMDVFIDEDGDGICDGRTFMRPMQMSMPGVGREAQPVPGRGPMGGQTGPMMPGRQQHKMGGGK